MTEKKVFIGSFLRKKDFMKELIEQVKVICSINLVCEKNMGYLDGVDKELKIVFDEAFSKSFAQLTPSELLHIKQWNEWAIAKHKCKICKALLKKLEGIKT